MMITINGYLRKLAAKRPTPGGGSAVALVGAIGISLLSMVARYTAGKGHKGAAGSAKLAGVLKFTALSLRRLKRLMRKDERAYLRLSRVMRRQRRGGLIRFYKAAAEVPLEVCAILHEGLLKCDGLAAYCKKSLSSDLAEAALLLEAGFLSAKLNVEINLCGIKNVAYTRKARRVLSKLEDSARKAKKRILKKLR